MGKALKGLYGPPMALQAAEQTRSPPPASNQPPRAVAPAEDCRARAPAAPARWGRLRYLRRLRRLRCLSACSRSTSRRAKSERGRRLPSVAAAHYVLSVSRLQFCKGFCYLVSKRGCVFFVGQDCGIILLAVHSFDFQRGIFRYFCNLA